MFFVLERGLLFAAFIDLQTMDAAPIAGRRCWIEQWQEIKIDENWFIKYLLRSLS